MTSYDLSMHSMIEDRLAESLAKEMGERIEEDLKIMALNRKTKK